MNEIGITKEHQLKIERKVKEEREGKGMSKNEEKKEKEVIQQEKIA
jgi:hypothetical protein